jgi:hypothetical protein
LTITESFKPTGIHVTHPLKVESLSPPSFDRDEITPAAFAENHDRIQGRRAILTTVSLRCIGATVRFSECHTPQPGVSVPAQSPAITLSAQSNENGLMYLLICYRYLMADAAVML